MKTLAYIPLHYGKDYLGYAIESIKDHVDKIIILYTPTPSYGHGSQITPIESEQELKDIAFSASNKIQWESNTYHHEGEHRNHIDKFSDGYDLVLACDADEVFADVEGALKQAYDQNFKRYGVNGFINFWKTFDKVCLDGFRPIRIIKPSGSGESEVKTIVYHFGYCISEALMRYKWAIHGHADELRQNWIDEVYLSDRTQDLHPVAIGLWNLVPYDKNTLPELLKKHPYYDK